MLKLKTLKHALRNLLRNRRRTLSTLCAIVVGAVGILLFGGYNHSIKYSLQTTFVRSTGHLQIQHRDYLLHGTGNPAQYSIRHYQKVMDIIAHDPVLQPMLTVSTPVLMLTGIAGHYAVGTSRPALIYGSEAAGKVQLNKWDEYHLGDFLQNRQIYSGAAADSAFIGGGLARLLQLCNLARNQPCSAPPAKENHVADLPSDLLQLSQQARQAHAADSDNYIELLAASGNGAPNIVRVIVEGIQPQPARELDDSFVGIHLHQAQQLLFGQETPGVTAIILQLHSTSQLAAARARLQQLFTSELADYPLAVYDFTELQPLYNQVLKMFANMLNFMLVLILAIALFTVTNTMGMAVMERTVEIGTLRAVGQKRRDIQRLFLSEGSLLGMFGSIIGVIVSLLLACLINHAGLTWQPPGVTVPIRIHISVWGEWAMISSVVGVLLLITVISSWWPARRAANVSIVEALRHI